MENIHKTIAVIDIGSNSIRLQVARVIDRTYKVINDYKATVRIGDNVYKTGEFSEEAIDTLLQVLTVKMWKCAVLLQLPHFVKHLTVIR